MIYHEVLTQKTDSKNDVLHVGILAWVYTNSEVPPSRRSSFDQRRNVVYANTVSISLIHISHLVSYQHDDSPHSIVPVFFYENGSIIGKQFFFELIEIRRGTTLFIPNKVIIEKRNNFRISLKGSQHFFDFGRMLIFFIIGLILLWRNLDWSWAIIIILILISGRRLFF